MAKKAEIEQKEIEAPYELPEGWKWVRLGDVVETSKEKTENFSEEIKYVGLEHIDSNGTIIGYDSAIEIKSLKNVFHQNQILYGKLRPYLNKHDIADFDGVCSTDILVFNAKDGFSNKYINYFFNLPFFIDFVISNSKGINLPRVSESTVLSVPFPLPTTIAEQQRIVSRIESMFAKLDEAKEKAQNVVDSFETRKAAILHQAFTGELTAKWRKENGVSDDSWEEKTVGDCCSEVKVGIVIKPTRYYTESENGVPAFRSANVRENHIDNFDWVYINDEGMKNEQRSIVHTNDVLVVRSGAPGTACVVTEQFDGYNAIDILIAVPLPEVINSYFLCYYTNSPMGKNIVAEKKRGLGLTHFNVKGYSATPIKVPFLPEQQEIVRILDTVLEKETRAKEAAQTVLDQIALLKKSILARAFRGDL